MNILRTFQQSGTYRLRFHFSKYPRDWTLIILSGSNLLHQAVKRMPICNGTEIDFQIIGDGMQLLAAHRDLIGISVVPPSQGKSMQVVCAHLIRRFTKQRLAAGHRMRVVKASPLTYLLATNGGHKPWHDECMADHIETAQLQTVFIAPVPPRYLKPSRKCLLSILPSPATITELHSYQAHLDQVIIAVPHRQLEQYSASHDLDGFHVIEVADDAESPTILTDAASSGIFDGFDFTGLILDGNRDGAADTSVFGKHSQRIIESITRISRDLLFGSRQDMENLLSVFERHPAIDLIASPIARLASAFQLRDVERFFPSGLGRQIWLRTSAIMRGPSAGSDIRHCIFNKGETITARDGQLHYQIKSGLRVFFPAGTDVRDGEPACLADYRVIRSLPDPAGHKIALFVSYAPGGRMRPHSFHYMRQLRRAGYLVYALAANDRANLETEDPGPEVCDALAARENIGFDFALWSAAIQKDTRILQASDLLLVNDSVIGPLIPMDKIFASIDRSSAAIVGLTDSSQIKSHTQSFFLHLKKPVISSDVFAGFVNDLKSYADKNTVIEEYEINFISRMAAAGFSCEPLFASAHLGFAQNQNPSIECWRELLAVGFPFLKADLVRCNPRNDDLSDMEATVRAYGDHAYLAAAFEHVAYWPPAARGN